MATWEVGMGILAEGALIKVDADSGVEFYLDGKMTPADQIPAGKWFAVKRTDPELGQFIIVSTTPHESKIRLAKQGSEKCPDWAKGFFGSTCTVSDDFSIHGK